MTQTEVPASVRRLDTSGAATLAGLAAVFDDLQMVLRCCERLMGELAPGVAPGKGEDVALEAFWTSAVLSYGRCFSIPVPGAALTGDDITSTEIPGDLLGWHRMLLALRDHYVDQAVSPSDALSVGIAQDADGTPTGIAITSSPRPRVDDLTVRQTGAVVYALTRIVDQRIADLQSVVFGEASALSAAELTSLPLLEVAEPTVGDAPSDPTVDLTGGTPPRPPGPGGG